MKWRKEFNLHKMPVRTPWVFEAQAARLSASPSIDRREFLLVALSALLVPKRSIFLPPIGGWPGPWKCVSLPGGFWYDDALVDRLKLTIAPLVRFRDMAETAGVEPAQPVRVFHDFQGR